MHSHKPDFPLVGLFEEYTEKKKEKEKPVMFKATNVYVKGKY